VGIVVLHQVCFVLRSRRLPFLPAGRRDRRSRSTREVCLGDRGDGGDGVRLGIDIGGTKTEAVAVDGAGDVVAHLRRPTGSGAGAVLKTASDVVAALAMDVGTSVHDFTAVGVGVPGMVERVAGHVRHAVNLGVEDLPLAELLSARFSGVPVVVENDVNAAALGAYHMLSMRGSMGFLNLGTGLAAGIVLDGSIWHGSSGVAGEIGHVPVDPHGVLCACGQTGCLETKASGSAVARIWPTDAPLPAVDLFEHAQRGEEKAVRVCEEFADGIASAIRMLALTVDVDVVTVGGGLSNLGEPLLQHIVAALGRAALHSPFLASLRLAWRVRMVPTGSPIAALGAALAAAGRYERGAVEVE
jgi:predicted NBD/HSP70 family sugar kinase